MTKHRQAIRRLTLLFFMALLFGRGSTAAEKPKVRAITAFVHLDQAKYQAQVREALQMLRKARDAYQKAGYKVETIRVSTQPFPEYTKGMSKEQALAFFHEYDLLAQQGGFDAAIGPAMLAATDDPRNGDLAAEVLGGTKALNASVVVAGDDGVHWNAVRVAARVMKFLEGHTPHSQGNFSFAATALVPPLTPFYPGSYHTGLGHQFAIALESANVVAEALVGASGPLEARRALAATLAEQSRAIEAIAQKLDLELGWQYMGIDLSPAPLKEVSIVDAMESYSGAKFGTGGTLTTAALITDALREIGTKRVGYSGLMLPILEDAVLAQRWSEGLVHLDALLAYSAVCGTGLDTVPLPGDVTEQQLERIIGDMATLAVKLHKPLSARLLPVAGKKPGERTEFDDPFLVNAVIQPLPPE